MLDINLWEIALYIINIVILFLFLRFLLYKPITKFLKSRSDSIRRQIEEAAAMQTEAEQLKAKYDEMVEKAQELAAEIINQGKSVADKQAEQIISDAEIKAQDIRERTDRHIDEQKKLAVVEVRQEVTNIAIQIAEKVLEREVSYADNKAIIDNFFEKVG